MDDPVDYLMVLNKRDDPHMASTCRATQGVHFIHLSDHLCPAFETGVAPAENFLHKRKPDELFPKQQREDLVGEDFLDNLVMETTDTVKSAIRDCVSRGVIFYERIGA